MDIILNIKQIVFIIICTLTITYPQEILYVTAEGSFISKDLSRDEAYNEAIRNAKINALHKAKIPENVQSISVIFDSQINDNLLKAYESISTIESKGEVLVDSVIYLPVRVNEVNNLVYDVKINAIVYKYEKKQDPEFLFNVEGIKEIYSSTEKMKFSFLPKQDGFLKIFNITKDEVSLLYPNVDKSYPYLSDEENHIFKKDEEIIFPYHPAFIEGYSFILKEGVNLENNYFLFVYTKNNIPFDENPTLKGIYKWIYSISPDIRCVKCMTTIIKK